MFFGFVFLMSLWEQINDGDSGDDDDDDDHGIDAPVVVCVCVLAGGLKGRLRESHLNVNDT